MLCRSAILLIVGSASTWVPLPGSEQTGLLQKIPRASRDTLTARAEMDGKKMEPSNVTNKDRAKLHVAMEPAVSQLGNRSRSAMMVQQMMGSGRRRRPRPEVCQLLRVTFDGSQTSVPVKPGIKEYFDDDRHSFLQKCRNGILACLTAKGHTDCSTGTTDFIETMVRDCGQRWCCAPGMVNFKQGKTNKCIDMIKSLQPEEPEGRCQVGNVVNNFCSNLKDLSTNYADDLLELERDAGGQSRSDGRLAAGQEPRQDEVRALPLAKVLQQRAAASRESKNIFLEESTAGKCV